MKSEQKPSQKQHVSQYNFCPQICQLKQILVGHHLRFEVFIRLPNQAPGEFATGVAFGGLHRISQSTSAPPRVHIQIPWGALNGGPPCPARDEGRDVRGARQEARRHPGGQPGRQRAGQGVEAEARPPGEGGGGEGGRMAGAGCLPRWTQKEPSVAE